MIKVIWKTIYEEAKVDEFPRGSWVDFIDGALVVYRDGDALAAFAPGVWTRFVAE